MKIDAKAIASPTEAEFRVRSIMNALQFERTGLRDQVVIVSPNIIRMANHMQF